MSNHLIEVWVEGWAGFEPMGEYGPAELVGVIEADNFREACITLCTPELEQKFGDFDNVHLRLWGRRLFDNESEARKSFG